MIKDRRGKYQSKTAVKGMYQLLFLLLAALFVWVLLPLVPPSEKQCENSVAQLEYSTYYEVSINGQPSFFLDDYENWTTSRFSTNETELPQNVKTVTGIWIRRMFTPLCHGRLIAVGTDPSQWESEENSRIAKTMQQRRLVLQQRVAMLQKRVDELQYYLRVHNVRDEGYNLIAEYEATSEAELTSVRQVLTLISDTSSLSKMRVRFIQQYVLLRNGNTTKKSRVPCHILEMDATARTCVVQTPRHLKPFDASAIYDNGTSREFRLLRDSLLHANTDTAKAVLTFRNGDYQGVVNRRWVPQGHGVLSTADGGIYNGMWQNGQQSGFGILLAADGSVRIGEWKENEYQGERPTYTAEHIYGIDISRYQHDIGKKHYSIDWNKVRITHLGSKSNKRIAGTVDYPVEFCYIKSTEGTTITNKYYANDYANARKRGIRCGAYHFFSTRTSGTQQAQFFIKNTFFRPGDLPPVLDVEPSAALIKEMGGTEVMLNRIRVWMKAVENHTGVKPILYVSQNFINKYLADAADIKENYQVWIARYGEYKPDVRLTIWQLAADGQVRGITGDVDINVFNGYRDQYEKFLERDTIRAKQTDDLR